MTKYDENWIPQAWLLLTKKLWIMFQRLSGGEFGYPWQLAMVSKFPTISTQDVLLTSWFYQIPSGPQTHAERSSQHWFFRLCCKQPITGQTWRHACGRRHGQGREPPPWPPPGLHSCTMTPNMLKYHCLFVSSCLQPQLEGVKRQDFLPYPHNPVSVPADQSTPANHLRPLALTPDLWPSTGMMTSLLSSMNGKNNTIWYHTVSSHTVIGYLERKRS